MMKMAWTAWTTSGGHISLSFPTLQVDENKSLSFCFYTVILDFATENDSWTSPPALALTVSRGTSDIPDQPRVFTSYHLSPTWEHIHRHSSFCFCMKLYLSLRSHAVAATVLLLEQLSEVILQSLGATSPLFICASSVTLWFWFSPSSEG